jgi:peptidyl-prolyl cis-trans isomerase SurA
MPSAARTSRCCSRWLPLLLAVCPIVVAAQPKGQLVDRILAVVGREAILQSEVIARTEQARQSGLMVDEAFTCAQLEDLMMEKLLVEQARIDSVTVEEAQVEAELDRRIRYFSSQIGGDKKLEEFYGKSIAEIKADFREQIQDQLLMQTMQQKITTDVRVTPRDVQRFYARIPADSVPFINSEVEYAQVMRIPKASLDEERRVRRKIEEYREGIVKGEKDFCTIAILYSEDPGSAKECGELGLVPSGVMVPEFDAVAMSLKEGDNARHVLMRPQVGAADLQQARTMLDTLLLSIRAGRIDFGTAAAEHSDDEESRGSNGVMIDPSSNSTRWELGGLDQQTFFVLDKLKPGEVSEPQLIVMPDGSKAYRLVKLLARTEPHRANLKDDYRLLQQAAEGQLRAKAMDAWVKDNLANTYVRIADDHAACPFEHEWVRIVTDIRD